ncbi:hypothetical protein Fmac_021374 [Flemingia macrophylla]|uniref:Uncharacterized protein n=1 Tax=Flemingia macrophylla TaxID=520843 RepID=A0ABD1LWX0_9FABA
MSGLECDNEIHEKDNLIPSSQTTNYNQSIQLKATRASQVGSEVSTLWNEACHKEVSKMIVSETRNPLAIVDLIDSISRLGVK